MPDIGWNEHDMIKVTVNQTGYEYDIHSLVKAFFPGKDVFVSALSSETEDINISIMFEKDRIRSVITTARSEGAETGDGCAELFPGGLQEHSMNLPPDAGRKEIRNAVKTVLYRQLAQATGRELPWGNLTGIRPTKIPMDLLNERWKSVDIISHMQERYFVSASKAELATRVALTERKILDALPYKKGYSLYIGIPFCPTVCLYCSFSSSPLSLWENRVDAYLDALIREMKACADLMKGFELQSIYIGGGTPTTLTPAQMDRLLSALEQYYDRTYVREITVEAGRPDTITGEKLKVLKDHGIGRISINPQSMNQKTLDTIGRRHTVKEVFEAFALARDLGFSDINMDTIVGLPGEGIEEVRHTMETLAGMSPENITVHSLALKRAARLKLQIDSYAAQSFTNSDAIMDMTRTVCEEASLFPYYLYRQKNMAGNFENVGYARPGKEGLYNILIMEEVQSILALGAGAMTKLVEGNGLIERIENVKNIEQYIDRIDEMIGRKRVIPEKMALLS